MKAEQAAFPELAAGTEIAVFMAGPVALFARLLFYSVGLGGWGQPEFRKLKLAPTFFRMEGEPRLSPSCGTSWSSSSRGCHPTAARWRWATRSGHCSVTVATDYRQKHGSPFGAVNRMFHLPVIQPGLIRPRILRSFLKTPLI